MLRLSLWKICALATAVLLPLVIVLALSSGKDKARQAPGHSPTHAVSAAKSPMTDGRPLVATPAKKSVKAKKVKTASLMTRLGALPDRRHLLLERAVKRGGIPRNYLVLYKLAAARYHLGSDGWAWLAGVGYIESFHGQTMAHGVRDDKSTPWIEVNHYNGGPYCCSGPMQFNIYYSGAHYGNRIKKAEHKSTWYTYGIDANKDGVKSPHDARDAIFAAALKLGHDGRRGGRINWTGALLAYNNSMEYVEDVAWAHRHYLAAARRNQKAIRALMRSFLQGDATVRSADMRITRHDRRVYRLR